MSLTMRAPLSTVFLAFVFLSLIALVPPLQAATIGTVVNVTGGASDVILDEPRQRLYLVRPSPYDQIDVYSLTQRRVTNSIRTDSLPLAAALSRDGKRLYVTCHNSTSINVIDVDRLVIVLKISLPARPEGIAVTVVADASKPPPAHELELHDVLEVVCCLRHAKLNAAAVDLGA